MADVDLGTLADILRSSNGIAAKHDIGSVTARLGVKDKAVPVGDDCAALPDGDGYLHVAWDHHNNPLRYAGLTFYQAGFDNNDRTSVLQVVENPSWFLPYLACLLVTLGLLVQFGAFVALAEVGDAGVHAASMPPCGGRATSLASVCAGMVVAP